jgi:squalene-hopene/tetraprenyl-beta-curcumene cyclase
VLSGLLAVGEEKTAPYVQRAVTWMSQIQNKDGGYGESTESYVDASWIGKGASTPSQTAWAMLTLLDFGLANSDAQLKAAKFLIDSFDQSVTWRDPSPVGTGHPGSVYMQYNSYAKAFPLLALAKLAQKL